MQFYTFAMMKDLNVIQKKLGSILLPIRAKSNGRTPKVFTFANAKTIGILCNIVKKETYQDIMEFTKLINRMHPNIQVSILGFIADEELGESLSQQKNIQFFSAEDFSWSGKLVNESVKQFATNKFDILLDITTNTVYPIQYIVRTSNASYKVGRFIEDDMQYDLMLDTKEENTIPNLITQINVYLTKIKTK